jgi:hypothetical protein
MATPRHSRSNVRAGIAVLAAVTLLALAIWGWNALQDTRRMTYVFWFRAAEGVYGLRVGSPVTIGGVKHGEVTGISPPRPGHDAGEEASALHFRVEIAIDPEVRLYAGVKFHAVPAGVGGDSIIEIYNVGRPTLYSSGGGKDARMPIQGDRMEAQPSNAYRQWFGPRSAMSAQKLMTTWFPAEGGDSLRGRLEAILSSAEGAPEDPDSFAKVRERAEDTWKYVTADFDAWDRSYQQAKASIDSALAKIGDSANPAPGTVRESWAAINRSWETWPAFPTATLDAVEANFGSIERGAARIGPQVGPLLKPDSFLVRELGETGAQGSLTLQEFKAAKTEAILSPWRLVERPDAAYLADDHRREAARLYAEAATEHRWVLKSIEEALRRDAELLKVDANLAGLLRARLEAANATFEERRRQAEELLLGPERPAAAPK